MKVVVDADTDEILGAAIFGVGGDEAIHCILDVMSAKAPYTTLSRTMHIHPTVSELIPTVLQEMSPLGRLSGGRFGPVLQDGVGVALVGSTPASPGRAAASAERRAERWWGHQSHSRDGRGRKSPVWPADWIARQIAISVFSKRSSSSASGE